MTNEALRDGFEAWLKSQGLCKDKLISAWTQKPFYQHPHIESMWAGWQASAAYLHQHNDFARRVREVAIQGQNSPAPWIESGMIRMMCDKELGNG